jgi:senataxin
LKKTNDSRKIMVCAPSNAAVDHIVKRIQSEGLLNGAGEIVKPIVLRVGIV